MSVETIKQPQAWPNPARAWWAVGVLTFAYIVSFIDRTAMSLLIEPIKADLNLSDVQIALLQGAAFGVFYTVMGLPLGWLADRKSRVKLIMIGAGLWCIATAMCGLSKNFVQMFMARIGVGVGEAALSPSALSIISDNFPKERRGLPIAIYSMAVSLGTGLALLIGGWVIQLITDAPPIVLPIIGVLAGWQAVFFIIGIGGIVLIPLMMTVKEPVRRNDDIIEMPTERPKLWPFLFKNRDFFGRHYGGLAVCSLLIAGVLAWAPAYFIRVHGWTPAETGFRYGLMFMICGPLGTVGAGYLSGVLTRRGVRGAALMITGTGVLLATIPLAMAGFAADGWTALAWFCIAMVLFAAPGGVAVQALQEVCPNALRGQAAALYFFAANMIGMTFGPLIVATLTEKVFGNPMALGWSLGVLALVIGPISGLILLSGLKGYRRMTHA